MSRSDPIQSIPLDKLVKSPANVRKTPPTEAEQAELKANIAADGLHQNLVVRRAPRRKGVFEVIAGGRRLDILKELQAEGALPADYAPPCKVKAGRNDAQEISLAENTIRAAMHPADEFEAFAKLAGNGQSAADIARRFGATEKHVLQRLKLGKVAPQLLQAYRAGGMNLEILMAFTVSEDHEVQRAVWKQVEGEYHASAHTVRRLLTEKTIPVNSRLGRFVGAEAYEAAGGHVTRDLFSEQDEGYLEDAALVRKLASEKLEARAKELEADWKWAKAMIDPDYGFTAEFGRVYPEPVGVPKKVEKEIERLDRRHDELENLGEEDWNEAVEAEAEKLVERRQELREIVEKHLAFSPEDRARAGCIVTVGRDGDMEVHPGLIPRDELEGAARDSEAPCAAEPPAAAPDMPAARDTAAAPLSPEQTVRKENGLSQAHMDDLKAHRLQITQAHLAGDFHAAFDLALYSLCIDILVIGYRADPLDLRAVQTRVHSSLNDLGDTSADRMLSARREGLSTSWLTLPPSDGFATMCALAADEKQALFAWCVAQSLNGQLAFEDGANPLIEQVGARLGIDFAAHWRPTADNYWGRATKGHGLDVGGEVLGDRWRRNHAKDKKPVLAKSLEAAFSDDPPATLGLDAATRARAAQWVPPGFAYDAVDSVEDRPDDADADHGEAGVDGAVDPDPGPDDPGAVALPEFLNGSGSQDGQVAQD
jgi:ParB family chromosome partitioning protein